MGVGIAGIEEPCRARYSEQPKRAEQRCPSLGHHLSPILLSLRMQFLFEGPKAVCPIFDCPFAFRSSPLSPYSSPPAHRRLPRISTSQSPGHFFSITPPYFALAASQPASDTRPRVSTYPAIWRRRAGGHRTAPFCLWTFSLDLRGRAALPVPRLALGSSKCSAGLRKQNRATPASHVLHGLHCISGILHTRRTVIS
jgi:hypothetical protein